MKKILSILLVLAMLVTGVAAAMPEQEDGLPAVGDTVEGFVLCEEREFPLVGGTAYVFEHEQTGARFVYIANRDTNRVFDLTFFTRAIDNTGLPHVFEHATLNGSEKYPSSALFFNLSFQTYNTFMNAMTYPLMTTYPVASLSEEQLLRYADFYTDSCLHPSILEDESIFREEAWRYRMASLEDELSLEGTVYSEMLGAMDLDSVALYNMLRAAFPGSTIGNVSGGDPASIPDMTWEALRSYHDTYYHPSNCVAFLYGDIEDYTAFLKLLDEAFAPYDKREFSFEDPDYSPLTAPVEQSLAFPVEAGSAAENRSTVYYAFVCPGLRGDTQEELVLNTLTDLLIAEASPLIQQLKKALPYGSFGSFIEDEGPEDAILFSAENVNPEDAELFRETVDAVLAEVAEKGFAQDLVDGVMSSLSLSTKLTSESSEVGVQLIPTIAYSYASSGELFNYFDYVDALDSLDDWNRQGVYARAVADWLLGSETTALITTYPEPGLREQLDAAEAERLAAVKASMSEEELQAIVDATNAEKEEKDASAYVAQLQAVTVESLPEEQREYAVKDETGEDGIRRLSAEAGVDGIGQTLLLLDAAGIPQEDLHWFALYTALIGELDTSAHSVEELAALMTRYLYSGSIRLSVMDRYGSDEYHPYLRAGWIAADEDLAAGYDLVYELLYDTQFSDYETMLGLIRQNKASLKSGITAVPYTAILYRELGAFKPLYAYYDHYNYLDFYAFLDKVEQQMETDPAAVQAKLEEMQRYFHNRTNAVSAYAGSAAGIETNAALADAFLARLDAEPIEAVTYVFDKPAQREAVILDSPVQYNCVIGDFASMGLDGYTADLDAVASLVTDLYLFPQLREQYGVYTPMHGYLSDTGAYFVSYRDPNVRETFEVYEALPEFLAGQTPDQETLDGYILSTYSVYAMPEGELTGALSAISSALSGEPADLKLQYMRELKALTPEKLTDYAAAYEALMAGGIRSTAGGAAAINANADLYDLILNPFGSVDATQVTMADVGEEHEHYEAVRFVYENMLMAMLDEEHFGVDEAATTGDVAGALYAVIGGDASAQDEAVATLASYGILPAEAAAGDELSGAALSETLAAFGAAIGVDLAAEAGGDAILTRGELAEQLMQVLSALEEG